MPNRNELLFVSGTDTSLASGSMQETMNWLSASVGSYPYQMERVY